MESEDKKLEITTKITYDIYRKYHMFSLFRGRLYKRGPAIFFIIVIIGGGISLFSGLSFGFDLVDILLLSVLFLMTLFMIFLLFISPKIYYKSSKTLIEAEVRYDFWEDYMVVEAESELANGSSKITYSALHKVYEIEELILLYLNNRQAYIIPKKSCTEEDINNLRIILERKVEKYVNYFRRNN